MKTIAKQICVVILVLSFIGCQSHLPLNTVEECETFVKNNEQIRVDTSWFVSAIYLREQCYLERYFLLPDSHKVEVNDTLPDGEFIKIVRYARVDGGLEVFSIREGPYIDCKQ